MSVAILLFAFGAVASALHPPLSLTTRRFDGYKVLKVIPVDRPTLQMLHNWMINDIHLDFWEEPSHIGVPAAFMVPPEHLNRIETNLRKAGLNYAFQVDDVQGILTPMWNDIDRKRAMNPEQKAFNIEDYNTLTDINSWMTSLVSNCRVGLTCEMYSVGNSYEGRPIYIFKISKTGTGRKAYWIDATIHAREWIATATALKVLNHLATGGDANAVRLTDAYDWYLMPVMNPDGYDYTWTSDRLWRKNRRPDSTSTCFGTDLNRNFDFRWGNDGVSFDPCAQTFCGPSAGSEPETVVVSAELVRLGSTLAATVTVHSYGEMWMFPWGNTIDYAGVTCERSADHAELMVVADATADAIENTPGTNSRWSRGNSCEVIYATTGGTDDYSKGAAGVKYAFCPELRGNNFVIAASNITPSFNEFWSGIVAMCDSINA
jgi:carboxypeptidase A2